MAERDKKGRFAEGHKPMGAATQRGGQAVENGRKGGIASGEAKRERKHWKELLQAICGEKVQIKMPDKSDKTVTMEEAVLYGQIREAMKGNTQAAKFIATVLGEYVEKQELTGDPTSPVVLSFKEALKGIDTTVKDEELFED